MFNRNESLSQYIKYYPVISILIGINLIIYLLGLIPSLQFNIIGYGVMSNFRISEGDYWRLLSSMFLHADFLHLLFNMFGLYVFGPELERIVGKMRFFNLYMLSGIIANVLTYIVYPLNYSSLGASGAIFGIFGAYLALVYYTRKTMPQFKQLILPLVGISVMMTFIQPNINITAHIGGLIVGFLIGLYQLHPKRITRWQQKKAANRFKQ